MTIEELEYKEQVLRHDFKEKLKHLNVSGHNDMHLIKCVKMYGALWHYTHQLLLAELEEDEEELEMAREHAEHAAHERHAEHAHEHEHATSLKAAK